MHRTIEVNRRDICPGDIPRTAEYELDDNMTIGGDIRFDDPYHQRAEEYKAKIGADQGVGAGFPEDPEHDSESFHIASVK